MNNRIFLKIEKKNLFLFVDGDCMDTISTAECDEAKTAGSCGNIDWASTNCAETCDLCCDLC